MEQKWEAGIENEMGGYSEDKSTSQINIEHIK
jgi:hypothetical protein